MKYKIITIATTAIIAIAGTYALFEVRCHQLDARPKPYDVARYEVYSAILNGLDGNAVLIQDDTRAPAIAVALGEPARVDEFRPSSNSPEANEDYRRHSNGPQVVERRFTTNKTYQLVSFNRVADLLLSRSRPCQSIKDFAGYDRLVVLSPVGFNANQTAALTEIYLSEGSCFAAVHGEPRGLRKRCGRWKLVDDVFGVVFFEPE